MCHKTVQSHPKPFFCITNFLTLRGKLRERFVFVPMSACPSRRSEYGWQCRLPHPPTNFPKRQRRTKATKEDQSGSVRESSVLSKRTNQIWFSPWKARAATRALKSSYHQLSIHYRISNMYWYFGSNPIVDRKLPSSTRSGFRPSHLSGVKVLSPKRIRFVESGFVLAIHILAVLAVGVRKHVVNHKIERQHKC